MRIPRLAIENYPFTVIVLLLVTLLGGISFLTMPRSEDPQFDIPRVSVTAVYPGAGPEDLESLVVDPIEEEINEIDDIEKIETTIKDGVAVTTVQFLSLVDPDDGVEDVQQAVSDARNELPPEVRSVEVDPQSTTDVTIYQVALTSPTAPYDLLGDTAERLEQSLGRISGVKEVETWAYPNQEVRVGLDLDRLRETGISLDRVVGAVQSAAQNVPGGDVSHGSRQYNVQVTGEYESLEQIEETVVGQTRNGIVYLRDVATVEMTDEKETHRARFNGERAVFVTVAQRSGVNIFNVLDEVKASVAAFESEVPGGVDMQEVFDQSTSVESRVNGFFMNLLQGILLVGGVILLALGFRASVIVMLAIPLSILIAIGWLDYSGYGLQQISIVGLVIALGLLVDDAIVITENVARYVKKGYGAVEAAVRGTDEVGWAVVSTSATSILAFLPIVLVESGSGDFIRSMPLTVIYALGASLLVSLTLTPLLASRWLGASDDDTDATDVSTSAGPDVAAARTGSDDDTSAEDEAGESLVGGPLQRWLQVVVDGPYRRLLKGALQRPAIVLAIAVVAFAGSVSLFPLIGVSFFPNAEKPQFLVNVTMPEGMSLDATDRAVQRVEATLDTLESVRRYAGNVGRDNPTVYYNAIPRREKSTIGQVYVEATSADAVPPLVDRLETLLVGAPDAEYDFEIFKNGPPVEAPIAIKVIGPELESLDTLATRVEGIVRQTTGTQNVDNPLDQPKTDLRVDVNRDRAGLLGVQLASVDRAVRMAMAGLPVARYRDASGDDHDIVVQLPQGDEATLSDLEQLTVPSVRDARVPLREIATIEMEAVPTRIDHFDTERAVTITADVNTRAGYSPVEVTQEVVQKLDRERWPPGYRYYVGGELEAQEDSFSSLAPALIGAIFGILAVLVLQFNSFRQPFIIFTAIPFAIIGAFPALLITGYTFSFTAFVGFTSLVGIVVNNSTILVDYANQLVKQGHSILEAVRISSETRFIPIILTTLTTIGGLLPLTLTNTQLWSPLGWVIIGGLLVSTLLTLIVVPSLYLLLTPEPEPEPAAA